MLHFWIISFLNFVCYNSTGNRIFIMQVSGAVLITIVLFKLCQTSDETASFKDVHILSKIFRDFNKHFNATNAALHISPFVRVQDNHLITSETAVGNGSVGNTEQQVSTNINLQQRSEASTPWICESEINWKDLGNLHYPRFVKEVLCLGDTCMHGFYTCISQYYPIRVLSARDSGDALEIALPRSLRQNWKFMDIEISVNCLCGN